MLEMFGHGVLLGIAIAAPVGPIGVLCIRHTLSSGRLAGLVTGLGAATADGIYGCIAGLGLSAVSDVLTDHQRLLGIGGGLFLCYLGIKTFLSRVAPLPGPRIGSDGVKHGSGEYRGACSDSEPDGGGECFQPVYGPTFFLKTYLETLLLTLANPATILSFTGIFIGLGMTREPGNYEGSLALVFGVFIGSALWWLTLSSGVGLVRDRLSSISLRWINRASGVVITAFGLVAITTALVLQRLA
ncbi:MAG: LysE family translocator [Leptolyngbyaceae cyanobacterium]